MGGTALNEGPAPVRTLARAARLVRDWSSWETFGLRGPRPEVDLAATLANADRVARHAYERSTWPIIRASGRRPRRGGRRRPPPRCEHRRDRGWPDLDRRPVHHRGRRPASRLPIPGAELALTLRGRAHPERPARSRLRDRSGRHRLPARLDPGRLRLRVWLVEYGRGSCRARDRRRLGGARAGVPDAGHRGRHGLSGRAARAGPARRLQATTRPGHRCRRRLLRGGLARQRGPRRRRRGRR